MQVINALVFVMIAQKLNNRRDIFITRENYNFLMKKLNMYKNMYNAKFMRPYKEGTLCVCTRH